MARLDRDRTPALFAVTTSVLSGVILAALTKGLQLGISAGATLVWSALVSAAVAVAFWAAFALKTRKRPNTGFLMTSAFEQKYYVAALVQQVHRAFDREDIDLVLKVPDRDYDAGAQARNLRRIVNRKHCYVGGIIVAGEVVRLREDLAAFCRAARLPVVFSDLEPFPTESEYPDRTAFFGYDTGQLGEMAGQWLVGQLRGRDRPRVLIIASREHDSRQKRCEKVLRAALPDVDLATDDRCEFVRSRAYNAVQAHLRHLEPGRRLDAIFCTNDEMALGAVDALTAAASAATRATVVIGVDGVLEARTLIDTGDSPLRATVVQDAHRLAVGAVDLLVKMRRGDTVPRRTILNAELYEAG
ncbi:sugar ABC transporter substrate-binding protein [Amycolatopsis balhimycina DSM 5908]|uniref:Sugar ABC transporter substrate-binding protein n=1 Tax=Amycolatopsis balhimycina DSM 5908 TaxID=1081091 RepID=A0A428WZZ8_AMYBA|nr:substrate-binding domain-containing protein [Amycolatopsis balhimycina]RSM48673.1 sugar ABC transporter substrate-binding protein [Amycolatopsis balhimycina DSM 5908]